MTRPAQPLRRERRPDQRPQELLEAALDVFARKGYRAARLDDVAEAAGVTKGAIYHYFDTKEELLLGVVEHFQDVAFGRVEDVLRDKTLPPSARIGLLVRRMFSNPDRTRGELFLVLLRDVAHEMPRVHHRWLRTGPMRLWGLIASLVEEGKEAGEFRADADSEVGARLLVSGLMLQLIWQQHAPHLREITIDEERVVNAAVELFLASLRSVG
ncbi:MAG: TetR/AcrR family transcriptional regulator [Gemmatimonadota bacterium]